VWTCYEVRNGSFAAGRLARRRQKWREAECAAWGRTAIAITAKTIATDQSVDRRASGMPLRMLPFPVQAVAGKKIA
jgi:hypothetical protein